ncbi:ABC transporter substrate-binding protein [Variovorax sp. J22R115]|uniref:ABC transporter substrate-binding protein n=1 Tax=Variovorax sp. J22R115 TaxID=3053509 RepID=UPI002578EC74|nr:ABC transporter substrate-binding protein [Variovorax sp. J22R115]MDM0047569.1 ABC transporter substrate-binding protein [Variovorax sp. J22R115]
MEPTAQLKHNQEQMMDRRRFAVTAAATGTFLATPLACRLAAAQTNGPPPRIGLLLNGAAANNPAVEAVRKGFSQLGYVEGRNVILEGRYAEGKLDRLPGLAAELVETKVEAIATFGGPPTSAALSATKQLPIIFAVVADPIAVGWVSSLERPGANATGITNHDPTQPERQVELIKKLLPDMKRLAILSDADIPGADASGLAPIERTNVAAAEALGIEARVLKLRGPTPEMQGAFDSMAAAKADALLVLEVPVTLSYRKQIADAAAAQRITTMFSAGSADAGGLLSFGTKVDDAWPRVPFYVDRILKGAKPADLPVEVIDRRDFIINLKTAKRIGLPIPQELLTLATRVVE